jgi:hypothetical protein
VTFLATEEKTVFSSQSFRFAILGRDEERRSVENSTHQEFEVSSTSCDEFILGLMLDGKDVRRPNSSTFHDGNFVLEFDAAIQWNGWFFITSTAYPPSHEAVRFALYAQVVPGSPSVPVGSSSYVKIHTTTILFHLPYVLTLRPGRRESFDLYRLQVGSLWISILSVFGIGLAGGMGREDLGTPILFIYFGTWAIVHMIRVWHYYTASQPVGCAVYIYLCTMQTVNLLLASHDKWQAMAFWFGASSVILAAVLSWFDGFGAVSAARFYAVPGITFLLSLLIIEVLRHRNSFAARLLVGRNHARYDKLWESLAATEPGEIKALHSAVLDLQSTFQQASLSRSNPLPNSPRGNFCSLRTLRRSLDGISEPAVRKRIGRGTCDSSLPYPPGGGNVPTLNGSGEVVTVLAAAAAAAGATVPIEEEAEASMASGAACAGVCAAGTEQRSVSGGGTAARHSCSATEGGPGCRQALGAARGLDGRGARGLLAALNRLYAQVRPPATLPRSAGRRVGAAMLGAFALSCIRRKRWVGG